MTLWSSSIALVLSVFSVVSCPVDRNHDVARNALRRMVRERENVGQIIVFKELAVRL